MLELCASGFPCFYVRAVLLFPLNKPPTVLGKRKKPDFLPPPPKHTGWKHLTDLAFFFLKITLEEHKIQMGGQNGIEQPTKYLLFLFRV